MGQYYKPLNISDSKIESLSSWDYDNGAKLMEHSWIGNYFVDIVINLLAKGGKWHNKPIIWAGDYGEYYEGLNETEVEEIKPKAPKYFKIYKYLINKTKKEFVKIPEYHENLWQIHPLPLLTCDGNGNGGGDFYGNDENNLIGSWKLCIIEPTNKVPDNYKEIIFDLKEN